MRDFEIRNLLKNTKLKKYLVDNNSLVIDEWNIPTTNSRVDVAVVNGKFHGFEIKGSQDSLSRLSNQIKGYSSVFDFITVVTEQTHLDKILELIPDFVGIMVCKKGKIQTFRKPSQNSKITTFQLAMLLWRDELIWLLKELNIPYKSKERNWLLCERLNNEINPAQMSEIVRTIVKERKNWKTKS